MFDKIKFSELLKNIVSFYDSIRDFSKASGFNRTSLSEYIRCEVKNPPTPDILRGIADSSYGLTTYVELLEVCGYLNSNDLFELREKANSNNEPLIEAKVDSNIEEVTNQVRELVDLLERAYELINSLSKK